MNFKGKTRRGSEKAVRTAALPSRARLIRAFYLAR